MVSKTATVTVVEESYTANGGRGQRGDSQLPDTIATRRRECARTRNEMPAFVPPTAVIVTPPRADRWSDIYGQARLGTANVSDTDTTYVDLPAVA